ncbi:MAG: autotransporter domain-containing protein [Rhodoferax sp.]|nr:autotransporter domain-containing protein [Rhodoferax sp.]
MTPHFVRRLVVLRAALMLLLALGFGPLQRAHAQSVAQGASLYTTNATAYGACSGCHFGSGPPNTAQGIAAPGHPSAANNYSFIKSSMQAGLMFANFGAVALPTDAQLFALSMYIGQYVAPAFTVANGNAALNLAVPSGGSGSLDLYPLIASDGSGGVAQDGASGFTKTNGANGTVSATQVGAGTAMSYLASYSATGSFIGTDSFSVTLTNPAGSASRTIAVTVVGITSSASATGVPGQAFSYTITTNGTPSGGAPYSVGGGLPDGLTLNSATGAITGTPTGASSGTYNLTLSVTTTAGTTSKAVSFDISGITSASTANGIQNDVFPTYTITTSLSASAYGLTGTLPTGLVFNSATGQITGTATLSGDFNITVQATTPSGIVQRNVLIRIASAGVPLITTTPTLLAAPAPSLAGTVGTPISSIQVNASNPPISANSYAVSAGTLPPGLTLNSGTGLISGTPTTSGDYPVTLSANNSSGAGSLSVVMRVNANAAPTINSSATGGGTVGIAGTQYTITTTGANGPVSGYSIASGALPPGLALNATTGVISGTPTTSGLFALSVGATNTGGKTATQAITLTINPDKVPTITSPANGSATKLSIGIVAALQIEANNPPLLSFSITQGSLPTGLSLDASTGLISGTPTTPTVASNITITATNAAGVSSPVTFQLSVGVPTPKSCTLKTMANAALDADLQACMFPDLVPNGFSVTLTPAHGVVSVNGTRIRYVPTADFFGTDSFGVVAFFGGGVAQSSVGIVTVLVEGRPDPAKDPSVKALVSAQMEASLRFSQSQIANYGRHLESLHGRRQIRRLGQAAGLSPALPPGLGQRAMASVAQQGGAAGPVVAPQQLATPASLPLGTAPASLPLSSAVAIAGADLGIANNPLFALASGLAQNQSVDLGALSKSFSAGNAITSSDSTSIWAEGMASFGVRGTAGTADFSEFRSSVMPLEVDHDLSDRLTVGLGVGYARDSADLGTDGTFNAAKGYSAALYASYLVGTNTFVEGLLGAGAADFESRRFAAPANAFAFGTRRGQQIFGSIGAGYEFRDRGRLLSPYGRLEFSTNKLDQSTETGAGNFALTYFEQTASASQAVLGLRGESVHATPFGWVMPRARLEWRQDLQETGAAEIAYADQIAGSRYAIAPGSKPKSMLAWGVGSDFVMRDGWTLGLDYQLARVSSEESSFAVRVKLSKSLGGKGLPKLLPGLDSDFDDDSELQVDAGYIWDDNVTRSKIERDIFADSIYSLTVSKTKTIQSGANSRWILAGSVGGERFQTFNGLSRVNLGAEASYQYRASSEFDAATWSLFGKAGVDKFQTELRDGVRLTAGASVLQPWTDRITAFAALSLNQRRARSSVFSTQDSSFRVNLDYALGRGATLYWTGEYRRGDIVSTGRASLENASISKVFVLDDAFATEQLASYRFDGTTMLMTLGYNKGLGPRDSLDIGWRRVQSTPGLRPDWVTSPSSYISNQLSANYLMRF